MKKYLPYYVVLSMAFWGGLGAAVADAPTPLRYGVTLTVHNSCGVDLCYYQAEDGFRGSITYNADSCNGCPRHCFPKGQSTAIVIRPSHNPQYNDMAQIVAKGSNGEYFTFITGYGKTYCSDSSSGNTCVNQATSGSSSCNIQYSSAINWGGKHDIIFNITLIPQQK
jgi:hypothetical protein